MIEFLFILVACASAAFWLGYRRSWQLALRNASMKDNVRPLMLRLYNLFLAFHAAVVILAGVSLWAGATKGEDSMLYSVLIVAVGSAVLGFALLLRSA